MWSIAYKSRIHTKFFQRAMPRSDLLAGLWGLEEAPTRLTVIGDLLLPRKAKRFWYCSIEKGLDCVHEASLV